MAEENDYKLCDYSRRSKREGCPIYCIKFCQFLDNNVFAIGVLNTIEIHEINNAKVTLLKTFQAAKKDEYFYALDWSFERKENEVMLIAGGAKGRLYNIMTRSIFGINITKHAINDIKFSPSVEYLVAVAYEHGLICLFNTYTEVCVGIFETMGIGNMKEVITMSFDPTGKYLAFGGMSKDIFIANISANDDFQRNLVKSMNKSQTIVPENFNTLHIVCIIEDLHDNYIDNIMWYGEYSLITKSSSGDIIFWCIEGVKNQAVPFSTKKHLKVLKHHTITAENCNLWFMRFSVDPSMKYLTVGAYDGELYVWNLQGNSFKEWNFNILRNNFSTAIVRHSSFSPDGEYMICCTDDGFLVAYKKSLVKRPEVETKPAKKTNRRKRSEKV